MAKTVDEVILLCAVDRNTLEIMVGNIRQKCCHKIIIGEAFFQARYCHAGCGMGVHDAVRIVTMLVDRAMYYVARKINRIIAISNWVAI